MAMSYGIATLTSDLEAMKEIVDDGENGFLFESDNHVHLASVLRRVLADRNSRQDISNNALTKMKVDFSWLTIGTKLADIYRMVGESNHA